MEKSVALFCCKNISKKFEKVCKNLLTNTKKCVIMRHTRKGKERNEVKKMKDIETVRSEIEQRENSIKEMEKKLKEARKELRQFEKYRGLKFDAYRKYRSDKYNDGMARETFVSALRVLTLYIIGVEKCPSISSHYLDFKIKKVSELNFAETKLCNDFLDEIYPIIEKYVDMVLENKEA